MNGWFPSLNELGEIVSGAGEIFVNGVSFGPGTLPVWKGKDHIVFNSQVGAEHTVIVNVRTKQTEQSISPAYSKYVGSDSDVWAGLWQGNPITLRRFSGTPSVADPELFDCGTPALSPDGKHFAYTDRFHDNIHTLYLDGHAIVTGQIFSIALSNTGIVWTQVTANRGLAVFGRLYTESAAHNWSVLHWETPVAVDGPDGLYILSVTQDGLIFRKAGSVTGWSWTGEWLNPAARYLNGAFHIVASDSHGTLLTDTKRIGDPTVDLTKLQPVTITFPKYAHPMWVGYFDQWSDVYGDNPNAPENCTVVEQANVWKRCPVPVIASVDALPPDEKLIAIWVSGATETELEQKAGTAKAANPNVPILGYLDKGAWARVPKNVDWFGVQAYMLKTETTAQFEARVRTAMSVVSPHGKIALVGQSYDTNAGLTTDLTVVQPVLARLATDANVIALLWFSDGRSSGAQGGARVHPELYTYHRAILAAVPGTPPMIRLAQAPSVTISDYDKRVTAGGKATMIASIGGRADTISWLVRPAGTSLWRVDVTNPATDKDHHMLFPTPGQFEIAAKVSGPGGTNQTGLTRIVTVTPVVAPPPVVTPPPEPPPVVPPVVPVTPPPAPRKKSWWQKLLAFFGF